MNVRNLERVQEKKFKTYEEATAAKSWTTKTPVHKVKVFARYDGTYDVVWYKKIETAGEKVVEALEETVQAEKKVHGQKSKDRKKNHKK